MHSKYLRKCLRGVWTFGRVFRLQLICMGGDSKHLTKHLNLSTLHRNTMAQQIVVTLIMSVHPTCLMVLKAFPRKGAGRVSTPVCKGTTGVFVCLFKRKNFSEKLLLIRYALVRSIFRMTILANTHPPHQTPTCITFP